MSLFIYFPICETYCTLSRQVSADYERVKRVFGPEQVAAAVQADKQREQAEKGRKRPRRSVDRGER